MLLKQNMLLFVNFYSIVRHTVCRFSTCMYVCILCSGECSVPNRLMFSVCVCAGTSPQPLRSVACASAVSRSWLISWERSAQERGSYWPSPSSTSILRSSLRSRAKSAAWGRYSSKPSGYLRMLRHTLVKHFYYFYKCYYYYFIYSLAQ